MIVSISAKNSISLITLIGMSCCCDSSAYFSLLVNGEESNKDFEY
ncbi:hypothetical protein [Vagococcus fluvialis]